MHIYVNENGRLLSIALTRQDETADKYPSLLKDLRNVAVHNGHDNLKPRFGTIKKDKTKLFQD